MFERIPSWSASEPDECAVMFRFEGQEIRALASDTVASALLVAGINTIRDTPAGNPRGPYCLMGACYDCLVTIDGQTVQACMTPVSEGLTVTRQSRADSACE